MESAATIEIAKKMLLSVGIILPLSPESCSAESSCDRDERIDKLLVCYHDHPVTGLNGQASCRETRTVG